MREQLLQREHSVAQAARGAWFVAIGLAKKVLVADTVAPLTAALDHAPTGALDSWVAILAYAVQIYFDFSGYSDMAIGLGLMLGFEFPPNFDSPYQSRSITEFWRRWHISLSTWLRDYLYIPLGGNRRGTWMTYRNLMITMLLGGLWHGASWTFVVWGAWHGLLLSLERAFGLSHPLRRLPPPLQTAATFFLVVLGWVPFRVADIGLAGAHLATLLGFGEHGSLALGALPWPQLAMTAAGLAIAFLARETWHMEVRLQAAYAIPVCALLLLSLFFLLGGSASPFLYFQF
jgi:alginate O-acetyltransferase complex protein AlgI